MCYTNILQILDLSGIPLHAADRTEEDPFVIGGGPCTYNPSLLRTSLIFSTSEKERLFMTSCWMSIKSGRNQGRAESSFSGGAAGIEGLYVPMFYDAEYNADGTLKSFRPNDPCAPESVKKQVVTDVTAAPYPLSPVVPFIKATQDRVRAGDPARLYPGLQVLPGRHALQTHKRKECGAAEGICQSNASEHRT